MHHIMASWKTIEERGGCKGPKMLFLESTTKCTMDESREFKGAVSHFSYVLIVTYNCSLAGCILNSMSKKCSFFALLTGSLIDLMDSWGGGGGQNRPSISPVYDFTNNSTRYVRTGVWKTTDSPNKENMPLGELLWHHRTFTLTDGSRCNHCCYPKETDGSLKKEETVQLFCTILWRVGESLRQAARIQMQSESAFWSFLSHLCH